MTGAKMRRALEFVVLIATVGWSSVAAALVNPQTYAGCESSAGSYGNQVSAQCQAFATQAATCAADRTYAGTVLYYCDCSTGSDANCVFGADGNNGTSTSTPRRTYAQFVTDFNGAAAGTRTFAFCRGGAWTQSTDIRTHNGNSTQANPFKVLDYVPTTFTPAVDGQPLVNCQTGNKCIDFNNGSPSANGWYTWENLHFTGAANNGTVGFRPDTGVHDVTFCNITLDNLGGGMNISRSGNVNACYTQGAGPQPDAGNTCLYPYNITVKGCTVDGTLGHTTSGFFGTGDGVTYYANYFHNVGADQNLDHVFYQSGEQVCKPYGSTCGSNLECCSNSCSTTCQLGNSSTTPDTVPSQNESITYNAIIDAGSINGSTGPIVCDGVQFVSHGVHINRTIAHNAFVETGALSCLGFGVSCSSNAQCCSNSCSTTCQGGARNLPVTGNCWCVQDAGVFPETNYWTNEKIDDNLCINPGQIGFAAGGWTSGEMKGNLFVQNFSGYSGNGVGFTTATDTFTGNGTTSVVLANNTCVFNNTDSSNRCIESTTGPAGADNVWANNISYFQNASGATPHVYDIRNGSATLKGGAASLGGSLSLSSYQAITDGTLTLTVNGTSCTPTGIDFSTANAIGPCTNTGCTGCNFASSIYCGLSGILQNAIRGCGGNAANAYVSYAGDYWTGKFNINTGSSATPTTITVATDPANGHTYIGTSFGLSVAGGAVVDTLFTALDYNLGFWVSGPSGNWEQQNSQSFATLKTNFTSLGWEAHSVNADPRFISLVASGLAPWAPPFNGPEVYAGTATYAPAADLWGRPYSTPPDMGAINRYVVNGFQN